MEEYKILRTWGSIALTDQTITVTRDGKEHLLYRMIAVEDIYDEGGNLIAPKGTLGGYYGQDAEGVPMVPSGWVGDNAKVYGKAKMNKSAIVCGDAEVYDSALIQGTVSEHARVYGRATICFGATVSGNAEVYDNANIWSGLVTENARVHGNSEVRGRAYIHGNSEVCENATVEGSAEVTDNSKVSGSATISGSSRVYEDAKVCGGEELFAGKRVVLNKGATVSGNAQVFGSAKIDGDAEIGGFAEVDFNVGLGQIVKPSQGEPSVIQENRQEELYQKRKEVLLSEIREDLIAELRPQIEAKIVAETTKKVEMETTARVAAETTAKVEKETAARVEKETRAKVEKELQEKFDKKLKKTETELREKIEAELRVKIESELREEFEGKQEEKALQTQGEEAKEEEQTEPQEVEMVEGAKIVDEDGEEYTILKVLNGWGVTDITDEFKDANKDSYTLNRIVALREISIKDCIEDSKKLIEKGLTPEMEEIFEDDLIDDMKGYIRALDGEEVEQIIKKGTLGGYVDLEALGDWQDDGESWIDEDTQVFGTPDITKSAILSSEISDDVKIEGSFLVDTKAWGSAEIKGCFMDDIEIRDTANVTSTFAQNCEIGGSSKIKNSIVANGVEVYGKATIEDSVLMDHAEAYGSCKIIKSVVSDSGVYGKAELNDCIVYSDASIYGSAKVCNGAQVCGEDMSSGIADGSVQEAKEGVIEDIVDQDQENHDDEESEAWYKKDRERGIKAIHKMDSQDEDFEIIKQADIGTKLSFLGLSFGAEPFKSDKERELFRKYMEVVLYKKAFDGGAAETLFKAIPADQRPTERNMKSYGARVASLAKALDDEFGFDADVECAEAMFSLFRLIAGCSPSALHDVMTKDVLDQISVDISNDASDYMQKILNDEEIIDEVDAALDNLDK